MYCPSGDQVRNLFPSASRFRSDWPVPSWRMIHRLSVPPICEARVNPMSSAGILGGEDTHPARDIITTKVIPWASQRVIELSSPVLNGPAHSTFMNRRGLRRFNGLGHSLVPSAPCLVSY